MGECHAYHNRHEAYHTEMQLDYEFKNISAIRNILSYNIQLARIMVKVINFKENIIWLKFH